MPSVEYLSKVWLSKKARLLAIILASIMLTVLAMMSGPRLAQWMSTLETPTLAAYLSLFVSLAVAVGGLTAFAMRHVPKIQLDVKIDNLSDHRVSVLARITNVGGKRFTPDNVNLYLDEGELGENQFTFPHLLRHDSGSYDCALSLWNQSGRVVYPIELVTRAARNRFNACFKFRHLSSETILFVAPGESFEENLIIELPKAGVYRAMVVVTAQDADCICASRQFAN